MNFYVLWIEKLYSGEWKHWQKCENEDEADQKINQLLAKTNIHDIAKVKGELILNEVDRQ